MLDALLKVLDWFIPEAAKRDRSDLGLARNFVFTHLFGPALAQSMSVFLYLTDPAPGFAAWTMILCIWSFWLLPFVLKITKKLQLVAMLSVETLAFASLFGAYHYGGVGSPFMPWLIISLLLGFFYLSDRPLLVVGMFTANLLGFYAAYAWNGAFPERVALADLSTLGWISIFSAAVYMSWMAVYYANMIAMRSELQREAERHRATAVRLRQAKELADKANKARSIFLAKMSHELRTPLNAVIGYSEILLEDNEAAGGNEAKTADLRRINAAGKHLLSLLTDVLDVSKIEANSMQVSVETFALGRFVEEVVATCRPLVAEKGNSLVVRVADEAAAVATDATKLRQATLNLLSNAAKFTTGGVITLTVRRDEKPAGDWIEIAVQDTGIGISEEELPKLFQDFGQATASTASKYGGTGLGLALSQTLCSLMGGNISVESEPGRGSRFTIRVPARLAADDADNGPAADGAAAGPSRPLPQIAA
jgi:signal transduction histidine kinase